MTKNSNVAAFMIRQGDAREFMYDALYGNKGDTVTVDFGKNVQWTTEAQPILTTEMLGNPQIVRPLRDLLETARRKSASGNNPIDLANSVRILDGLEKGTISPELAIAALKANFPQAKHDTQAEKFDFQQGEPLPAPLKELTAQPASKQR